jgi:Zn-dependent membrane protease YugP
LEKGGYLNDQDMKSARQILLAAALTYVASSLASLLSVWRWVRYLRP